MQYPYLTDGTMEAAASGLLHDVFGGEPSYPVDLDAVVFDHLCERHGLVFNDELDLRLEAGGDVVGRMRPLADTIEISAHLKDDGCLGRYRFTVAHEIGHWVLHRSLFLASANQGDLFHSAASLQAPEMISLERNVFPSSGGSGSPPREEFQANRFAIGLLIDRDILRREFRERFGENPLEVGGIVGSGTLSARELARFAASATDSRRPALKDQFGLSTEAMAIALEVRGYVTSTPSVL